MERSFLEAFGLEKEQIDQIMNENGKDINRERQKADTLKTQLDEAKNIITELRDAWAQAMKKARAEKGAAS